MSIIFIDGFDKYGPVGMSNNGITSLSPYLLQGEWTFVNLNNGNGIVAGLSETGQALSLAYGDNLYKVLPSNYNTVIGGIRFSATLNSYSSFSYYDLNTVAHFSIVINTTTGLISINKGDHGAVIATSSTAVSSGSIHYLEWNVTIGAAGSYNIYLDRVSILSGTGDTQQGAVTTANMFKITGACNNLTVDDLYLFSNAGSINNAPLLTNPRIESKYPSSDAQTQFQNLGSIIGEVNPPMNGYGSNILANQMYLRPFTNSATNIIKSINLLLHGGISSAHFIPLVYSDSIGVPGSLITGGSSTVGSGTSGQTFSMAVATQATLAPSTQYWIGFMTDTSYPDLYVRSNSTNGQVANRTFTSGAPGTAPSMTVGRPSYVMYGQCSGATSNWESLNQNPSPGNISSISSSAIGAVDYYRFPPPSSDITGVYAVAVKGHAQISATGSRYMGLPILSGGSTGVGTLGSSGVVLATSYLWSDNYFETDPATGAVWTPTGVGNAYCGVKVVS